MRQRFGQAQRNRNMIPHSRIEHVTVTRSYLSPFLRRSSKSDDHQLIFNVRRQRF